MEALFDLSGKVALVTGGSRGLGREMVLAFAKAGADVVIASRKLEACEEVAREVEQLGRRALPVAAHVGQWEDNDFAPKVRVNCIAPGPFLTDVSTVWRENEAYEQSLGLKRFGRPEEIVGTALYLASDASSYVTGQVIRVDGGTW